MPSTTSGINWETNPLPGAVMELQAKLESAIYATFAFWTPRTQSYAREHAPWKDHTSNARNGLMAVHTHIAGFHNRITVFHTMPYGIWLEVKNNGEYAIIIPTIQHEGPQVMRSLSGIMGRLS
jgi:hypothetical protein